MPCSPEGKPVVQALVAAYMAQDAIERMHDATSIESATAALGYYALVLMKTSPEHHQTVSCIRDEMERAVPTLTELHQRYLSVWSSLYVQIHSTKPAAA